MATEMKAALTHLIAIITSLVCLYFPEYLALTHALMISYIIMLMVNYSFVPCHPAVWLPPFIYIYHGSTSLCFLLGIEHASYPEETTLATWIAIVTTGCISFLFPKQKEIFQMQKTRAELKIPYRTVLFCFKITFVLILIDSLQFLNYGAASKIDVFMFNMEAIDLDFSHSILILSYTILLSYKVFYRDYVPYFMIAATLAVTLVGVMILGERDLFLRPLATTLLVLSTRYYKYRFRFIAAGLFAVCLIPTLGTLKSIVTLGFFAPDDLSLIYNPLYGEFLRVGKNMEVILDNPLDWDFFYGRTLIWDFVRGTIPGFLYVSENPTSWFNNTFFADLRLRGGGNGFSLLAEGYINGGYVGIVVWYALLALFSFTFDLLSRRNMLLFSCYLYMIPFLIYVQRADFSNLISPFFKQLIVPFIIFSVSRIYYEKLVQKGSRQNLRKDTISQLKNSYSSQA